MGRREAYEEIIDFVSAIVLGFNDIYILCKKGLSLWRDRSLW